MWPFKKKEEKKEVIEVPFKNYIQLEHYIERTATGIARSEYYAKEVYGDKPWDYHPIDIGNSVSSVTSEKKARKAIREYLKNRVVSKETAIIEKFPMYEV